MSFLFHPVSRGHRFGSPYDSLSIFNSGPSTSSQKGLMYRFTNSTLAHNHCRLCFCLSQKKAKFTMDCGPGWDFKAGLEM